MINRTLTTTEAADRLGVKPATLYSYVSRGLLHPERSSRGSRFDLNEVVRLSRSARHPTGPVPPSRKQLRSQPRGGEPGPRDPIFVTELTLIEGGRLYYRGLDAVALSRQRSFEEVAEWLWTGEWPQGPGPWMVPEVTAASIDRAMVAVAPGAGLIEGLMAAVVAASLADDLRHDLNPAGVPVTGRALLAALAASLPGWQRAGDASAGGDRSISQRVWRGLARTDRARPRGSADGTPDPVETGAVEAAGSGRQMHAVEAVGAALVLAADHELAPSTMAARVAASFRADPYAVVLTGLGPASGSSYAGRTGAPSEVERLLRDAEAMGPERAIGERLRWGVEVPHGFGMPLYPAGDPRGAELLGRLEGVGPPERLDVVRSLIQLGEDRGFPAPNFDLGLGALSFCADLVPGSGQAIFTIGKVAGWLAHAIEEYISPTRFRSRADYVGALPEETPEP